MPQGFGTFDLGEVLRNAETIKGFQRQSRLGDLQEIALKEGIETQRVNRQRLEDDANRREQQFTTEQQLANTRRLLVGVQLAQRDPSLLPQLGEALADEGILDPQSIPQLIESAQADPDNFQQMLGGLESQLRFSLSELPDEDNTKGVVVSKGASLVHPQTGDVLFTNFDPDQRVDEATADRLKTEQGLRKEFNDLTKDFNQVTEAYSRVQAAATEPSAAGDLALIFNYMKMLDPGSTVREGEFATAQNAAGVPARVVAAYNNVAKGERMATPQRQDFVDRAAKLFEAQRASAQQTANAYERIATDAGVKPENVLAVFNERNAKDDDEGGGGKPTLRYNPQTGRIEPQ